MKEYVIHSSQSDALSQLDSMLQQIRDKARSSKEYTAKVTPGEDTVTLTVEITLPPEPKQVTG